MRNTSQNASEPIMVLDPIINQYVDLTAFFHFIHHDGLEKAEDYAYKFERFDESIKLITTSLIVDTDEISSVNLREMYIFLYKARDVFSKISILKSV
jgi:hypothetical protein